MAKPVWATPDRQAELVKLFVDSGGFCVFGHSDCLNPSHHYEVYIERLIDDWKEIDRYDWLLERKAMHSLGERRYPITGRFNNISMDIFHDKQPIYYRESLGMNGLTLTPFAKVRIGSSYMRLYVDLGNILRGVSKNKRRKAIRYAKQLPKSIEQQIAEQVWLAVRDYLNH
ncbi:MAG: hypothetical protein Q7J73_08020 [Dehalococcoidales bacterium]|nr:hypothetical protein [Dehalococcoidales bacterium]